MQRYEVARSDEAIEEQLARADEGVSNGTAFGGMSYEEGVQQTILWLTGKTDEAPMED